MDDIQPILNEVDIALIKNNEATQKYCMQGIYFCNTVRGQSVAVTNHDNPRLLGFRCFIQSDFLSIWTDSYRQKVMHMSTLCKMLRWAQKWCCNITEIYDFLAIINTFASLFLTWSICGLGLYPMSQIQLFEYMYHYIRHTWHFSSWANNWYHPMAMHLITLHGFICKIYWPPVKRGLPWGGWLD